MLREKHFNNCMKSIAMISLKNLMITQSVFVVVFAGFSAELDAAQIIRRERNKPEIKKSAPVADCKLLSDPDHVSITDENIDLEWRMDYYPALFKVDQAETFKTLTDYQNRMHKIFYNQTKDPLDLINREFEQLEFANREQNQYKAAVLDSIRGGTLGKIRELNCLEKIIGAILLRYSDIKFKPVTFRSYVFHSYNKKRVLVLFTASSSKNPPTINLIKEKILRHQVDKWKLIRYIHAHPLNYDVISKINAINLAPSILDLNHFERLHKNFDLTHFVISNLIHSLEIHRQELEKFLRYHNLPNQL